MYNRSLLKYKHKNEIGLMHYVVYDGQVVALTKCDSKKVSFIKQNGYIDVTFNIDHNNMNKTKAHIEDSQEYIMKVYQYMIETNNAYFYDDTEGLCAIILEKK